MDGQSSLDAAAAPAAAVDSDLTVPMPLLGAELWGSSCKLVFVPTSLLLLLLLLLLRDPAPAPPPLAVAPSPAPAAVVKDKDAPAVGVGPNDTPVSPAAADVDGGGHAGDTNG